MGVEPIGFTDYTTQESIHLLTVPNQDLCFLCFDSGSFPGLSALLNSLPTFLGIPIVLCPAAAACIALRCFSDTGGINRLPQYRYSPYMLSWGHKWR